MTSAERRILIVANYGHFMSHCNMGVFPAMVLPLASTLNMDMGQVLTLSFLHFLLFGATALPWGVAADRWGGQPLMALMFIGCSVSALGVGFWIGAPYELRLCLAGLGLFSGIYHPIGMGLISKGIARINLAMGYNAMAGGMGLIAAPLLTGLLNWLAGPRGPYMLVAVMNLTGLALMRLFPPAAPGHSREDSEGTSRDSYLAAFVILLAVMGFGGLAFTGATAVLPSYLELKSPAIFDYVSEWFPGGLSKNLVATAIASMIYFVGVLGQFSGGIIGERFEQRFSYLLMNAVCLPAALLMASATDFSLVGLAAVYFFFLLGIQPIENTLVARFAPKRLHHSAFGVKFVLTFGVGALAVKIAAWIGSTYGLGANFTALGVASGLMVATIALFIKWTSYAGIEKA